MTSPRIGRICQSERTKFSRIRSSNAGSSRNCSPTCPRGRGHGTCTIARARELAIIRNSPIAVAGSSSPIGPFASTAIAIAVHIPKAESQGCRASGPAGATGAAVEGPSSSRRPATNASMARQLSSVSEASTVAARAEIVNPMVEARMIPPQNPTRAENNRRPRWYVANPAAAPKTTAPIRAANSFMPKT